MGGWLYREEEEAELLRGRIWEKRLLRNMQGIINGGWLNKSRWGGGGGVCVCACGDTRMGMRRETFKGQVTRFAASVLILESLPYCRHNSQVLSNPTTGPCTVNVCNSWYRLPHTNYGTHVSWQPSSPPPPPVTHYSWFLLRRLYII